MKKKVADISGADLLATYTEFSLGVGGMQAIKLRLCMAFADATSYQVLVADNSSTLLASPGKGSLLTKRHNTADGNGVTKNVQSWLASDSITDDVLEITLNGLYDKLSIQIKRTGGTTAAGNRVQLEAVTP